MSDFQKIIIMGRLCSDPETKTLPSGDPVTDLRLAINRSWKEKGGEKREETCFIDAVCFGSRAPALAEFFRKGNRILVEGRLKLDEWEKDGQKRSKHRVVIESWSFVDARSGDQDEGAERRAYSRPTERAPSMQSETPESKLPF